MEYKITPTPKPRMSQRDKWLKPPRPCVARYRAFCDLVNAYRVDLPEAGAQITFFIPIPKSWSKKKKMQMVGTAHQQKPDISNLIKALEDALYSDDSKIWHYAGLMKLWGNEGRIVIK